MRWVCLAGALLAAALALCAQDTPPPAQSSLKLNFPPDSPVTVVSADWGESRASARGGALMLDLHSALMLRNSGQRRVRGVTLLVVAQDVTPGGKASVSVPSLDVAPGEVFPVRIDLRLLRPLARGSGPLVEVSLDGLLFEDLSFFGPNRLNSRRTMTAWELEARRDRRYFKAVLDAKGPEALRQEVLASLARQAESPSLDLQVARGRTTNTEAERRLQFAFLQFPDAPVEPTQGTALVAGSEARAPRLSVRNRADRPIRHFQIGWILQDRSGREFFGGTLPAETNLAPGQAGQVALETSLRFTQRQGQPLVIEALTGFVSQVEFSDGQVWVPSRASLAEPRLLRVVGPSPEEQRLTELYRKKGLTALIEELKKF